MSRSYCQALTLSISYISHFWFLKIVNKAFFCKQLRWTYKWDDSVLLKVKAEFSWDICKQCETNIDENESCGTRVVGEW